MFSIYQTVNFCLIFLLCVFTCTDVNCQTENRNGIDLCKANPCANKGICVQTNVPPGYKCQCYGTGFYGSRCKHGCPKSLTATHTSRRTGPVPTECIVI